jgi:hypothetical protein
LANATPAPHTSEGRGTARNRTDARGGRRDEATGPWGGGRNPRAGARGGLSPGLLTGREASRAAGSGTSRGRRTVNRWMERDPVGPGLTPEGDGGPGPASRPHGRSAPTGAVPSGRRPAKPQVVASPRGAGTRALWPLSRPSRACGRRVYGQAVRQWQQGQWQHPRAASGGHRDGGGPFPSRQPGDEGGPGGPQCYARPPARVRPPISDRSRDTTMPSPSPRMSRARERAVTVPGSRPRRRGRPGRARRRR